MIACRVENIDRPDGSLISRTSELWVSALEAWPIWIAPSFRNMSRVPMHELKHAESVSTKTGARISDGAGADLWAVGQVSGAVRWRPAASAALSSSTAVERWPIAAASWSCLRSASRPSRWARLPGLARHADLQDAASSGIGASRAEG